MDTAEPLDDLVCDLGTGSDGDGDDRLDGVTDFVLLHGTMQSAAGWDRLVATLDARGHRA